MLKIHKIGCILLIILTLHLIGCNPEVDNNRIILKFNLQKTHVSNISINSSLLHPIFDLENLSKKPVFVCFDNSPVVIVDSLTSTIELRYYVIKIPKNMTYYAFPYPLFLSVQPNSTLKLFSEVEFYRHFSNLHSGTWNLVATLGFLENLNYFVGFYNHQLRNKLIKHQRIVRSNNVEFEIIKE